MENITKNLNTEIKTNTGNLEEVYIIFKEYISNIIFSVEKSMFSILSKMNHQKNLNHDSIYELLKPMLSRYVKNLELGNFNEYDLTTFSKLDSLITIDNNKKTKIIEDLINLIYPFFNRNSFNINDEEIYLQQIDEQVDMLFDINKIDILKKLSSRK